MVDYKNISVDLIKNDELSQTRENIQTNTVSSQRISPGTSISRDIHMSPLPSDILSDKITMAVTFVDTKISSKYPLTLKEARRRALRSIDKTNERKPILLNDED